MSDQKTAVQTVLHIIEEEENRLSNGFSTHLSNGNAECAALIAPVSVALSGLRMRVQQLLQEDEGNITPKVLPINAYSTHLPRLNH